MIIVYSEFGLRAVCLQIHGFHGNLTEQMFQNTLRLSVNFRTIFVTQQVPWRKALRLSLRCTAGILLWNLIQSQ